MDIKEKLSLWLDSSYIDEDTKVELKNIKDEKELEDRFYRDLAFGTGGLRGVLGAGSNRMNIYTVGKATQGLANHLNNNFENPSVSIAFDSRNMSIEFADIAAAVLCANNIKVNLFESLRPTPMLSFTVRQLKSSAGIVVTASHNPKQYNGYKVYGNDGGQLTDNSADLVLSEIEKVDSFEKVKKIDLNEAKEKGLLNIIGEDIDKIYLDKVKSLTIREELVKKQAKDLKIIYTPIHGSGNVPVRRVLKELGYENVSVVKEQEMPNGNFPTAPYPNPEDPRVFELALKMAEDIEPDIIFGTDPDCDRIGVVVKDDEGNYKVLTGNQTGVLLSNYIVSSLKETNSLPVNGALIKTIVTTDMVSGICAKYGVEKLDVLTGFKYIGEKIKEFEKTGEKKYLFGFEESYGYLAGEFVRDKDAVIAATLICEMVLYYKSRGMNLYNALTELYEEYGYYKESLVSVVLEGKEGQEKIGEIIESLREAKIADIGGVKLVKKFDYKKSLEANYIENKENDILLPKSNVLKFVLEDKSWFVVRPSGTEPKMKIYLSVTGTSIEDAEKRTDILKEKVMELVEQAK
ncbi:MAG: phospho-sugar mutase [Clostridiaceae bacterium]